MKTIPVGVTYASFAGLTIIATTTVGTFKFNQIPDLYTFQVHCNEDYLSTFQRETSYHL